ncbi:anthranilate synthase component I [Clostridium algidicarnis]|uniref:anthranilate synthase component I n=1 Tax=Clostridium algidicarnis TaxID=37659 RepID=UPI001C0E1A61|nr:anthranilate synthase component I [Clostridium algidicarnis]MBU3202800.1 anthranilate synthase component I [Clostridium algidicarnis]MBU3210954.1 anthranilate synthase component I [Clostridium algidicarnis]MBU3222538.1 anthranilate synthase component I [Clostridium algidicarnis]
MYPDYEEFKRLSKEGKMVSISLEIDGDIETPISLFNKLCKEKKAFLLEGVEGGSKWGRYSYIGRNPFIEIIAYDHNITIIKDDEIINRRGDALNVLQEIMDEYKMVSVEGMDDFIGGAVGFIGYDLIKNICGVENINKDSIRTPDLHLLITKDIIIYDHLKQKIKIVTNVKIENSLKEIYEEGLLKLQSIKKEILKTKFSPEKETKVTFEEIKYTSNETKENFMENVLKAKEYIKNEEILQVVLSQRFDFNTKINPFMAYRELRTLNPSPYMYYINFGFYQVVGSSPELLVKVNKDRVETCPIAGTRPRGKSLEEDERYEKDLLKDKKEIAEHLMLVDLSKEDIGKISEEGTVKVDQFMKIQKYSHVMHIVSHVVGKMKKGLNAYDALRICAPAGTVSGAPKVRALEIIEEFENEKRGIYAGAIGYLGFNGSMDTCIAIRTIVFKDNMAYIQAGAGIVEESNPESEYEETLNKARALMECIRKGV